MTETQQKCQELAERVDALLGQAQALLPEAEYQADFHDIVTAGNFLGLAARSLRSVAERPEVDA